MIHGEQFSGKAQFAPQDNLLLFYIFNTKLNIFRYFFGDENYLSSINAT